MTDKTDKGKETKDAGQHRHQSEIGRRRNNRDPITRKIKTQKKFQFLNMAPVITSRALKRHSPKQHSEITDIWVRW